MNEQTEFYTARQIADKLEVNIMTIYRYIKAKKLSFYKFGKEYRISKADYDSFLKRSRNKI